MKLRLRDITMAGLILLILTFSIAIVSAEDRNATGNETSVVNETPVGDETQVVNETEEVDGAPEVNETSTVNITGAATDTFTPDPDTESNDEDETDDGLIGPGHGVLYNLKITFENMGETFIFNESEKLGRQVSNARHRINEARAALKRNDPEAANRALAEYKVKSDEINHSVSRLSDNDTGFINARKMILKHQLILKNLSISHPDNAGLKKAYNNTRELQDKFEFKHRQKADIKIAKGIQEPATDKKMTAPERTGKPENAKREKKN